MTLALVAVMLSQFTPPPMIDGESGKPVVRVVKPAEPETRRLWEVSVPGAVIAHVSWIVGIAYWFDSIECKDWLLSCNSASGFLWIPLAGPWLALRDSSTTSQHLGATVGLGVAQLVGLAAMLAGIVISVPTGEAATFSLNVHPTGNGFALGGQF